MPVSLVQLYQPSLRGDNEGHFGKFRIEPASSAPWRLGFAISRQRKGRKKRSEESICRSSEQWDQIIIFKRSKFSWLEIQPPGWGFDLLSLDSSSWCPWRQNKGVYTREIVPVCPCVYQTPSTSWLLVNTAMYTEHPFRGTVIYPTAVHTRSMTGVFISPCLLLYTAVYTVSQQRNTAYP